MAGRSVRIFTKNEGDDLLRIDVVVDDLGFTIDALDVSDFAKEFWGSREYEWKRTVRPEDFPALRTLLGGSADDDVLDLAVAWCEAHDPYDLNRFVTDSDVPSSFWSWHSD